MVKVELVRDMDHPAGKVWAVMEDFGNLSWAGAPRVEVVGEGVGMTRKVIMEGMDPIEEVLETMDPATMSFTYTIPRGMPLPVTDYRSGCRVESRGDTQSRVYWSCTCTATDDNMSESDVQALLEGTYSGMLDGLDAHLSAG